jgi:murein DD-endopeptidase MepM/ murein hydrolase activator NlpD
MARVTKRPKKPDYVPPPAPIKPKPPVELPPPTGPPLIEGEIPNIITPQGKVKTPMPWGKIDLNWNKITKYDEIITENITPVGWPIERVRGHIVVESQGDPIAVQKNDTNGWSYGLMQVVPYGVGWAGWHTLVRQKAGLPANSSRQDVIDALYDPKINIAVGVSILESLYQQYGSLDRASSAFFLGNPDWQGQDTVNGNTGVAYQRCITELIEEQRGGTGPPKPALTDLLSAVMGGRPYSIFQEFGSASSNGLYGYGIGHGLNGSQHTGIDYGGTFGDPLYTPVDGIVVCQGTNWGEGAHGSSCAAFNDYMGHKTGRVEVMTHDGTKSLIFGHSSDAFVTVGQRVTAGQKVASIGGMNGWHCHLEARTWSGGDYMIRDPRAVFGGAGSGGVYYAERVPIPQPQDFERLAKVIATVKGVPVLQRADVDAAEVRKPLEKGEEFDAAYQVISDRDGSIWWVTSLGSRVPVEGTESEEWPG